MAANIQRRRTVMARSLHLGHCVCDPRQSCPCDTLKHHNVCPCAGEKAPIRSGPTPLTRHVRKVGCASKIGQADLQRILGQLPPVTDPRVLLGTAAGDDAGVYQIRDDLRLVQTVDVFTPIVDDPYLFGQIAAANSVSDIYAMGARPLTALSIIGFPIDELDGSIMEAILRGGLDKLNEAGCALIGGHSINDEEIKCGFAVTGVMESGAPIERDRARPGDALVLTKPLGTGMVSFASQIGWAPPEALTEIGGWMAALNKDAAELMVKYEANACTDITGFGLAGHLAEMVRRGAVSVEIDLARLPVFATAAACLEHQALSGAVDRNREYAMAWVREPAGAEMTLPIIYDAQTSGGLLIALPEKKASALVAELRQRGNAAAAVIGRVTEMAPGRTEGEIHIIPGELTHRIGREWPVARPDERIEVGRALSAAESRKANGAPTEGADEQCVCCLSPPAFDDESSATLRPPERSPAAEPEARMSIGDGIELNAESAFRDFMQAANKPGLIDKKNKKLMALALSLAVRCEECARIHIKSALEAGITKAEIDEAAWLAISFQGCTGMMFYQRICREMEM